MASAATGLRKVYRYAMLPHLMRRVLQKEGWRPHGALDLPSDEWTLFWKNSRFSPEEYALGGAQHHYNHFPETYHLTKKGHLQFLMKSAKLQYGDIYGFFPQSFVLSKQSLPLLRKYWGDNPKHADKIWIGKPAASSQGRGITLTRNLEDFARFLAPVPSWERLKRAYTAKEQGEDDPISPEDQKGRDVVVVSEYIANPFLIGGYKSDLRIYVLVSSFAPLRAHLYVDGLTRFATKTYSTTDFDLLRHLTNTSIHTKLFDSDSASEEELDAFRATLNEALGVGDFSKWRLRSLFAYFHNQGIDFAQIWNRIRNVIRLTLLPLARDMEPAPNKCFELFGFDILLTEDLHPKLIEVNLAPSLGVSCPTDLIVKQPMLENLLNIVFEEQAGKRLPYPGRLLPVEGPNTAYTAPHSRGDYELLFPFDKETEEAARSLAERKNVNKNMDTIVERIAANYKAS